MERVGTIGNDHINANLCFSLLLTASSSSILRKVPDDSVEPSHFSSFEEHVSARRDGVFVMINHK